jgi:hypothetical protein
MTQADRSTIPTSNQNPKTSFAGRMLRAAMLDSDIYEEVEADDTASGQAFFVVLLVALAAAIGSFENGGVLGALYLFPAALVGWWVWAYLTYQIGTRLLPHTSTEADHGELLRTIGFSAAPGILLVFGAFPPAAPILFPLCGLWMLVAMVIGIRQALDYEGKGATSRAIAVCLIGFPIYALVVVVALLFLGPWPF